MFLKSKKRNLMCFILMITFIFSGCSKVENKVEVGSEMEKEKIAMIDTETLKDKIEDPNWRVVDTRINDAFNGWKLDGVKRGGRIKGATDFSANWLDVKEKDTEERLVEALEVKRISKEKDIVLYDSNGKDAVKVKQYLEDKGFNNIHIYNINEWANDESLPMEEYKNYKRIIPADVLKEVIDGNKPETFENAKNIKIVEVSWGEEENSYAKGHIPTSFHINTDAIEPPPTWMLASDGELEKFALENGFTKDDTVIVTGEAQMASYRLASVLDYIGVEDVRILNGGHRAWTEAGYELEKEINKPTPVENFGEKIPGNPNVITTIEEAKEILNSTDGILVDNRTWEEHTGKISGYSYHDKKGRIPGSIFGYAGWTDANSLEYYRNVDNTMRNGDEILEMWKEAGVDVNKHLAFFCGSGWRVAEIYYYADTLGIDNTSIFSDGWIGWSNGNNPIETEKDIK